MACWKSNHAGRSRGVRQPRRLATRRRGAMAIEALIVLATFVFGAFVFFYLGQAILMSFFRDGNHFLAIPLF